MKKYLIVKLSAIGDVVMALPLVAEIRRNEPNANITWVCGTAVVDLLRQFPIDRIVAIDEKRLLRGSTFEKILEVLKLWQKIGFHNYEQILLGHADDRYRLLPLLCRGTKSSFSRALGRLCPIPGRHHSDEYIRLIDMHAKHTVPASPPYIKLTLPKHLADELDCHKKRIVLTPGGARNLLANDACRRYPLERYVEVATRLLERGYQVILVGGAGDTFCLKSFSGLAVTNLLGKTNLLELIALFDRCDLVLTHDSGPMHLAGLTHTRILACFGPTSPLEKIPQRANVKYIWKSSDLACCPCYDGKNYAPCNRFDCMEKISVDEVIQNIDSLLGKML